MTTEELKQLADLSDEVIKLKAKIIKIRSELLASSLFAENEADESQPSCLGAVISRFFRWFISSCPKCKVGKLNQDDVHHCSGGGELNVYSCDKCKREFV